MSGENLKKDFGFLLFFFLGVRDGQIHRGGRICLGISKEEWNYSCAVCVLYASGSKHFQWISTRLRAAGPGYSQTSQSPIISNLNGRSIALCRPSSSACSIVISA